MFAFNYSMVVIAIETIGFLLPQMSDELDLSLTEQGWLSASVMFSNLIFEVPSNWLFSRFRPWALLRRVLCRRGHLCRLHGIAPTLAILFIARVSLGMTYLSTQASRTILVIHWIPSRQIGMANGVYSASWKRSSASDSSWFPPYSGWSGIGEKLSTSGQ